MAKVEMVLPDDFEEKLAKLGDRTDEILPKVLKAGAKVVEDKVRANLRAAIGKRTKFESRSTGELLRALGTTPAKRGRDGNYDVKIGFSEQRGDGGVNAKISNILEHGKSGQAARPFLKPAKSATKDACVAAMKAEFEKEIDSI